MAHIGPHLYNAIVAPGMFAAFGGSWSPTAGDAPAGPGGAPAGPRHAPAAPAGPRRAPAGPGLRGAWSVRAALCALAVLLFGLVAAANARAEAPPVPPGCPTPTTTSHSNTTPMDIPPGPGVVTSTLEVQGASPYMTDVDLFTDLTHTFAADLDITLQSPAGTVATISTDNGAGNDNVFAGTTFDDQADADGQVPYVTNPGMTTDHPYANLTAATPLDPEESLAAFNGEDPNGTWTITISDDLAGDGGTLNSWRLDIQSLPAAPEATTTSYENATPTDIPTGPAVVTSSIQVQGADTHLTDVDLLTNLTHTFTADLDITLQSPAGTVVTITTDNGAGNDNVFAGTTFDDQADADGQVPYVTNPGMTTDHPYANLTAATALVPEESLAAFNGEDPNGTWTMTISDDLAGDGGSLTWGLNLTTGSCPPPDEPDNADPTQPDPPAQQAPAQPAAPAPSAPTKADTNTAPSATAPATEAAALRLNMPRMSVFGSKSASASRTRPVAHCRMTAGPVGSCRVELHAKGRVIARGTRSGVKTAGRVRVQLKLTAAGRRVLASRLGGVRASVSASNGTTTAKGRTWAVLGVERVVTPAGSWVPNTAKLTPTGKQFVQSLRGRVVAVKSYRCDGHTAKLEGRRADSERAMSLSKDRARKVCRALKHSGATEPALVAHGGTKPIVSNRTETGRAQNRRVSITVKH